MTEGRWRILPAKSGKPALVRPDGTWVESRFAPETDAARRVADARIETGDAVLLLGMGAGELPRAILEAVGPEGRMIIAEPVADAIDAAIAAGSGDFLEDARVRIITSSSERPAGDERWSVCATPVEFYRALADIDGGARCLVHPGVTLPEGFEALRTFLDDFEIRRQSSLRFAEDFDRNVRLNASLLDRATPLSKVDGLLAGEDVIVAGGGPSLEWIARAIGADANWIAVGTALAPLHQLGIAPHFAVVTDPQPRVGRQLTALTEAARPPLVVFPSTAHEAIRAASTLIAASPEGTGRPLDELPAGGTVATTAIGLAIRLGARRVFLAGVDLAEAPSRTHARGTANELEGVAALKRFGSAERPRRNDGDRIEAVSVGGLPVLTRRNLQLYARAIEGLIARHSGVEFIQLSPTALPIRGARHEEAAAFSFKRRDIPRLAPYNPMNP